MYDWMKEKWADHLQGLQQSWEDDGDIIAHKPGRLFGAQRLLISQWVDFLEKWTPSTSPRKFDDVFQEAIDAMVPEAAEAVGLSPLDFWFKVTMLWNWRRARDQPYEDGYLMADTMTDLEAAAKRHPKKPRPKKRREEAK